MKNGFEHTQEAIKQRGEVFTPTWLANDMWNKIPIEFVQNKSKRILDPACGNGQLLMPCLERRLHNGISHKDALLTIYGVELDSKNAQDCRDRLLMGSTDKELIKIVNNNIICADALNPDHKGWKTVGYMWKPLPQLEINIEMFVDNIMNPKEPW